MRSLLADLVQLAFERVALDAVGGPDEQHLDVRLAGTRGRADVGDVGRLGDVPPTDQLLTGFLDQSGNGRLAVFTFFFVRRQEHQPGGESTRLRQIDVQRSFGDLAEELVGQTTHDARAVAGVGFAPARPAVIHRDQDLGSVQHVLV